MYLNYSKEKSEALENSKNIWSQGGIVVFPTETVYGIGCDIFNESAVDKVFEAKNREFGKPLAAHISNLGQVEQVAMEIPDAFYKLAKIFLPGPLALIIKANDKVPKKAIAGGKTISIRFPSNLCAQEIIENYGKPIAATSANISGEASSKNGADASKSVGAKADLTIDDGRSLIGIESTVAEIFDDKLKVYRIGAISIEEIRERIGIEII